MIGDNLKEMSLEKKLELNSNSENLQQVMSSVGSKSDIVSADSLSSKPIMQPSKNLLLSKFVQDENNVKIEQIQLDDYNRFCDEIYKNDEKKCQKPLFFQLHRHKKCMYAPSMAVDSIIVESVFRMLDINYEVEYDIKYLHEPVYIVHEGFMLTGLKKILHYLRSKLKVDPDDKFSPNEKATIRAFSNMLIDQTCFILNAFRFQEKFNDFKALNIEYDKLGKFKMYKMKKCLDKNIKNGLEVLGFNHWSPAALSSVAKEDLKNLTIMLGEKDYFMGSEPSSLDCICMAVVSNMMYPGLNLPLQSYITAMCPALLYHRDRMIELLWKEDWAPSDLGVSKISNPIDKKANSTVDSNSHKKKDKNVKRFSFRSKNNEKTKVYKKNEEKNLDIDEKEKTIESTKGKSTPVLNTDKFVEGSSNPCVKPASVKFLSNMFEKMKIRSARENTEKLKLPLKENDEKLESSDTFLSTSNKNEKVVFGIEDLAKDELVIEKSELDKYSNNIDNSV